MDPEDIESYKEAGKSLVPLPSPRAPEANEFFVALEKWEDAPAYMEKTTVHQKKLPLPEQGETTIPEHEFLSSQLGDGEKEKIFITRLRLRGPVSSELHGGKYVVMTMSRSNLKAIEYAVAYVTIVPSK